MQPLTPPPYHHDTICFPSSTGAGVGGSGNIMEQGRGKKECGPTGSRLFLEVMIGGENFLKMKMFPKHFVHIVQMCANVLGNPKLSFPPKESKPYSMS
jgi:hypothetical protein